MLTVSLHGIQIQAPHGLYPQEHILGNTFEIDVDVAVPVSSKEEWPFVDYVTVQEIVAHTFLQPDKMLEDFVRNIHTALKEKLPAAGNIKVVVRKMNPPLPGQVKYSQVSFEG